MYSLPQKPDKHHTWCLLKRLICVGDFNQVFSLEDKVGGAGVGFDLMMEFREATE